MKEKDDDVRIPGTKQVRLLYEIWNRKYRRQWATSIRAEGKRALANFKQLHALQRAPHSRQLRPEPAGGPAPARPHDLVRVRPRAEVVARRVALLEPHRDPEGRSGCRSWPEDVLVLGERGEGRRNLRRV